LQKLEGFAGMNASQLLVVATKVFINQDQEAKWEADRKMKRKMDLLAAVLDEQSGGHQQQRQRQSLMVMANAPRIPLP
jgi:hypothetical protein